MNHDDLLRHANEREMPPLTHETDWCSDCQTRHAPHPERTWASEVLALYDAPASSTSAEVGTYSLGPFARRANDSTETVLRTVSVVDAAPERSAVLRVLHGHLDGWVDDARMEELADDLAALSGQQDTERTE